MLLNPLFNFLQRYLPTSVLAQEKNFSRTTSRTSSSATTVVNCVATTRTSTSVFTSQVASETAFDSRKLNLESMTTSAKDRPRETQLVNAVNAVNAVKVAHALNTTKPHMEYRADIDGLRALAVLAVLIFHAFPSVLPGGFVGVDLFFVISGYLISSIIFQQLQTGQFSIAHFYERRIRRIFPSLSVVLLFCLLFGYFLLLAEEYQQLGAHAAAGAGFVANLLSWSEASYFDSAAETKPLLHLWSLGIEEQFYMIWPLVAGLFFLPAYKKYMKWWFVVLIGASFLVNLWSLVHAPVALYYSPFSRFWELLAGAALAYWSLTNSNKLLDSKKRSAPTLSIGWRHALSLVALLAYVLSLSLITPQTAFPGLWALLPVLAAVAWIAAGPQAWVNRYVLSNKVIVAIGLISYPLYLWHWPLLAFLRVVEGQTPAVWQRAIAVLLAFVLAYASARWIEKPLRYGGRGRFKTWALASVVAGLGLLGLCIYWQQGWPSRSHIENYQNPQAALKRTLEKDPACQNYVASMGASIHYCRMTVVGSAKTIAVIGDSHAHVAYPGIAEQAEKQNINTVLLANSSCPPFLGAEMGDTPETKANCRNNIEQLLKVVESKPDISTVFLFSRGTKYFTGIGFGEAEATEAREPYMSPSQFFNGLLATVQRLEKAGKNVYYVTENPEIGISLMACVTRPLRSQAQSCELKKQVVLERQKIYLQALSQLPSVQVIQSIPAFCPDDNCIINYKGKILYADDDHLSVEGSRFQVQYLLNDWIR